MRQFYSPRAPVRDTFEILPNCHGLRASIETSGTDIRPDQIWAYIVASHQLRPWQLLKLSPDFLHNFEMGHVRQDSEIQSEIVVQYRAPAITGLLGKGKTTLCFAKNQGTVRIRFNYAEPAECHEAKKIYTFLANPSCPTRQGSPAN